MAQASSSTANARNKLVIRRLPPTLSEDVFWNVVAPWITDKTCTWKRYVKGKAGDGTYDAHPVHSRAYVLISSPEAIATFHNAFDGHVFRSKAGIEYQAVVEFSPVQKTPYKAKVKVDARQGTIDDDPDFLSFMDSLNAPATKPALEVSAPLPQPTTTPLLEHLRTHAKAGTKIRGKGASKSAASSSSATESARRAAALASVTAAATKRAAQAYSGPVMVAGKGREVVITPTAGNSAPDGEAGGGKVKKGGRGKKKGKEGTDNTAAKEKEKPEGGKGVSQGAGGPHGQHAQKAAPTASTTTPAPKPASGHATPIPSGPSIANAGGAREGASRGSGGRGGGRGRGGALEGGGGGRALANDGINSPSVASVNNEAGGRGGRRGGGKDRTGRGQVMEILARNTAGSGGKSGPRGGGGGNKGGIVSDPGASNARIDIP